MVSVIIPTYNREQTILRAVRSVLDQTYSNIELIVVDDGSSDGTEEVLKTIGDPRLRLIKSDVNRGACAARNLGVAAARGELVAFQDSDDAWYPDKLEKQVKALSANHADIVFCSMRQIFSNEMPGREIPGATLPLGICSYEKLLEKSLASTQVIMGRRECFQDEPFDEQMPRMQDWDVVLRLARKYSIYYLNEVLADVFLQTDSLTMRTEKGLLAYNRIYEKNHIAIKKNPRIMTQHILLEGYLMVLSGKNPAGFYWRNISLRNGLKANAVILMKSALAACGLLAHFTPPSGAGNARRFWKINKN